MPLSGKEPVDPPGQAKAMPKPRPVKQAQPKIYVYVPPSQEERFDRLEVPPHVYAMLWEWGATPDAVEPVLRFLEHVKSRKEAHEATIQFARQVHGRARDPHHKMRPEEPGEIAELQRAIKDLVAAIEDVLTLHFGPAHAYSPGIALAVPHLEAVLKHLEQCPEIEFDPDLPRRTPGRKPGLTIALREGEEARPAKRKQIECALQRRLLPLHPHRSKVEVRNLSYELLSPILG